MLRAYTIKENYPLCKTSSLWPQHRKALKYVNKARLVGNRNISILIVWGAVGKNKHTFRKNSFSNSTYHSSPCNLSAFVNMWIIDCAKKATHIQQIMDPSSVLQTKYHLFLAKDMGRERQVAKETEYGYQFFLSADWNSFWYAAVRLLPTINPRLPNFVILWITKRPQNFNR